jgi:phosphoribosyl 1,2-cyclic phosphodiesterase
MSLFIASLNSGSNGNCYYVGNGREAILVDAGISCRETERRMKKLGLSMTRVKAVFISHEHTDHIRGLPGLAKKFNLPVYITPGTLRGCPFSLTGAYAFRTYEPVRIGELTVTGFPKLHDACEPHSFIVEGNGVKVGVFTDIGAPCDHLARHFRQCHAAFFESNYDEEMLDKGRYPYYLKKRIRGGLGHLSNREALEFFQAQRPAFMTHLILSHLSAENNHPSIVQNLFAQHAGATKIFIASRHEETPLFTVTTGKVAAPKMMQASLF